jgi:rhodanese-related sulfurtransferase
MADIGVEELQDRLAKGDQIRLLDVREELEFHTFNIGGVNIPLGKLPTSLEDLEWERDEQIVVICQRGIRSETGCRILNMAGFTNTRNLEGGLLAWRKKFND